MSAVATIAVSEADGELRLDRWFKRHYPNLAHGRLEKLLRTGQIRVDGKRAEASTRVAPGQMIRVPPLDAPDAAPRPPIARPRKPVSPERVKALASRILHQDGEVIVIDKPAGLAVQGGSGITESLDDWLDALAEGGEERPRLVHRLDRDTSGVLVLARGARVAAEIAKAFQGRAVEKLYWAVTVGVPELRDGRIDNRLAKEARGDKERMAEAGEDGVRAITEYRVLDAVRRHAALLELHPLTGRTHQLRVHCAGLGTPILGDGKYGGAAAFLPGADLPKRLHLHARRIAVPRPGRDLVVIAPIPPHFKETLAALGLQA